MKTLHLSKFSINAIIIILLSTGSASGMIIAYNYFTTTHIISKERAVTIDAELLQAKLSNRVGLVINDTTMSPNSFPRMAPLPSLVFQENQLFWDITIKKHLRGMEYQEWSYVIDATNGTLMGSWSPHGYTHLNF